MQLPRDFTDVELELYTYLTTGQIMSVTTATVYKVINDPIDKFLIAYVYELGKTRREAEIALGLSKATIWKRMNRIEDTLYKHFRQ